MQAIHVCSRGQQSTSAGKPRNLIYKIGCRPTGSAGAADVQFGRAPTAILARENDNRGVTSTRIFALLAALLAAGWMHEARADKKTVCTITVNSSDEKETFRRYLPADKYRFVELVERGRPDWLASACEQRTRCDVLVISGHYDGRDEFYSDQPGS